MLCASWSCWSRNGRQRRTLGRSHRGPRGVAPSADDLPVSAIATHRHAAALRAIHCSGRQSGSLDVGPLESALPFAKRVSGPPRRSHRGPRGVAPSADDLPVSAIATHRHAAALSRQAGAGPASVRRPPLAGQDPAQPRTRRRRRVDPILTVRHKKRVPLIRVSEHQEEDAAALDDAADRDDPILFDPPTPRLRK
jgi:hypothetical protein